MVAMIAASVLMLQHSAKSIAVETWDFVEVYKRAVPGGAGRPSVEFLVDEKKVQGHGGINRFSGAARYRGQTLKLGPIMSTKMGGSPEAMKLESSVFKALGDTDRWRFRRGFLELLKGKSLLARLVRHRVK